jgi:hypothetical protein
MAKDDAYQDKYALPRAFQHLGECIKIVVAIYVPGESQIRKCCLQTNKYTPLDGVLRSFTREAAKAVTRVDFRTYLVMGLSLSSIMPSYS